MTHSHVWHDSFTCVAWLSNKSDLFIHVCDMTSLILLWDMTLQHDSFISVTGLVSGMKLTHCNTLQHTVTHYKDTATHCNSLQHTASYCNTLQYTATHCNTLQLTATHCNTLHHTALHTTHCNTLQHTRHCNSLQLTATHHTTTHCTTLHHTAIHCNTLQHAATHCITLQHTTTHCNTLDLTRRHAWPDLLFLGWSSKRAKSCFSTGVTMTFLLRLRVRVMTNSYVWHDS